MSSSDSSLFEQEDVSDSESLSTVSGRTLREVNKAMKIAKSNTWSSEEQCLLQFLLVMEIYSLLDTGQVYQRHSATSYQSLLEPHPLSPAGSDRTASPPQSPRGSFALLPRFPLRSHRLSPPPLSISIPKSKFSSRRCDISRDTTHDHGLSG